MKYIVTMSGEFVVPSQDRDESLAFDMIKLSEVEAGSDVEALEMAQAHEKDFVPCDAGWSVLDAGEELDNAGIVDGREYRHGAGVYGGGVLSIHRGGLDGEVIMESAGYGWPWTVYALEEVA